MSENEFKWYLKNKYHLGGHIMKRYVAPNGQVPLEELYKQYGPKHGLPRDESFIVWLREVKLKDSDRWVVVDEDDLVETNKLLAEELQKLDDDIHNSYGESVSLDEYLAMIKMSKSIKND